MRIIFLAVPALIAGCTAAQPEVRPSPVDPRAKASPVEFRSALEGYRSFADPEPYDWRKANEEVGAAGGHAGQPGKSGTSDGHGAHR